MALPLPPLATTAHLHPLHHIVDKTDRRVDRLAVFVNCGNRPSLYWHVANSPGIVVAHTPIVGDSVRPMDIDPQAVIDALSRQIGALQTENTVLKMALQQVQAETEALYASAGAAEALEADKKKK